MVKKLIFILLMSGVMLSPKGAYAMDDEGGTSKALSSRSAPSSQRGVDEPVPPISIRGLIVSPGEHLKLKGDEFVNNAGTIVLPATTTRSTTHWVFSPLVYENGEKGSLFNVSSDGPHAMLPMVSAEEHIAEHPGTWIGPHHIFRVGKSGSIDAFPYIRTSRVPSAAPAPTLRSELEEAPAVPTTSVPTIPPSIMSPNTIPPNTSKSLLPSFAR
jgi:hypothetical protein